MGSERKKKKKKKKRSHLNDFSKQHEDERYEHAQDGSVDPGRWTCASTCACAYI